MYEMEGASQSRVSHGPIARSANPRDTPPSLGRAWADPGRLGVCLPEGAFPGRLTNEVRPAANSGLRVLACGEPPVLDVR